MASGADVSEDAPTVLDDTGKAALHTFLSKGGVFVGVHAAADGLRNATFFGKEVGARFDYHPELQSAVRGGRFRPGRGTS